MFIGCRRFTSGSFFILELKKTGRCSFYGYFKKLIMKSRAQFKSHPLHPMLVAFPIAFFTGSFVFDLMGLFAENPFFFILSYNLIMAGIISGLLAAIPGLIDLVTVVPPKSSGKKRGIKHGLLNVGVILIFALCLWMKNEGTIRLILIIGLELAGFILLMVSGFLGGTLVYRNQIGVDMRYAHAGKWKELYTEAKDGKAKAADLDELKVNQMKLLHVNGERIVLARTENEYLAFSDHCTHRGGSLAGGSMICGTVQCPWHGSQFDIKTGQCTAGPATENIRTYDVEISGNEVFVRL